MNHRQDDPEQGVITAKKTKVRVLATPLEASPWVHFAMDADYVDKGGKQEGEKLKFDANAGAFDLTFTLDDKTGLNLAFYPDPADAMWVAAGAGKPTGPGFGNGAIVPVSVSRQKLVVTNANWVAQTLNFVLRFEGTAQSGFPPYVYDPLIVNGGGGNQF